MLGASAGIRVSVVCAAFSLSWVAAAPAHADLGDAVGTTGGAVGGTVSGTVGQVTGSSGAAPGGAAQQVPKAAVPSLEEASRDVGGAAQQVTQVISEARETVSRVVGGDAQTEPARTASGVSETASGQTAPVRHATNQGTIAPAQSNDGGSASAPGQGERHTAASSPSSASPAKRHQLHSSRPTREQASTVRRMARILTRAGTLKSLVGAEPGDRQVATPGLHLDSSCQSASLAVDELRRCAFAGTPIPQLGGFRMGLLPTSLTMICIGLALVAYGRRRDAPVSPAT